MGLGANRIVEPEYEQPAPRGALVPHQVEALELAGKRAPGRWLVDADQPEGVQAPRLSGQIEVQVRGSRIEVAVGPRGEQDVSRGEHGSRHRAGLGVRSG